MRKTILYLLSVLLLVGVVSAAVTFVNPTTGASDSGQVIFNVTATIGNITHCNVTITSASTGDSTNYVLYNVSASRNHANATVETRNLTDATDYGITGTCGNVTGGSESITAVTGWIIDNTVPVFGTPTPANGNRENDKSVDFSIACSNATTAYLWLEGTKINMTESSDVCTVTVNPVPGGTSSWYVTATDDTNVSTSSTFTFDVKGVGGRTSRTTTTTTSTGLGTFEIILIVGALYLIFKKK